MCAAHCPVLDQARVTAVPLESFPYALRMLGFAFALQSAKSKEIRNSLCLRAGLSDERAELFCLAFDERRHLLRPDVRERNGIGAVEIGNDGRILHGR